MEHQAVCPIEFALDQQMLRVDTGGIIKRRREALNLSIVKMADKIGCTEKALHGVELGELFPSMPRIRLEALILLDMLEGREVGRRAGDKPVLRIVSIGGGV